MDRDRDRDFAAYVAARGQRLVRSAVLLGCSLPEAAETDASDRLAIAASVREVLRTMSLERRTVLVLRYFADLTDLQIADVLGAPIGTVKSRLSRALDQLSLDDRLAGLSEKERTS